MGIKTIQGSMELAERIRRRRNELGLTIEEAASKAGVGTKTWSRYEAGESIRRDKYSGICKVLRWNTLLDNIDEEKDTIKKYRNHEAWSEDLATRFGPLEAVSFAVGSDILLDHIEEDMQELSKRPKGTHLGEIDISWLQDFLPPQFLMRYDYEFLFSLRWTVLRLRRVARAGHEVVAHSVMEELAIYLMVEESSILMENMQLDTEEVIEDFDDWAQWIFDIFDDCDIMTFLYSDIHITPENTYHFDHWTERQFFC